MSLVWQDPESRAKPKPEAELPLFDERAHWRRNDPETSKDAAKSVVNLGRTRDAILRILKAAGPATDEQIWKRYQSAYADYSLMLKVSPSGLRSRRSELVRMGFVVEGGTGKTQAGRNCTIWRLK